MTASAQAGVSVPVFQPNDQFHRRQIAQWAQWVNQGHLANTGLATLSTSVLSTVVLDSRVSINTVPILQPSTANALSAAPAAYVSTISAGGFTITHASSNAADRIFRYALLG